MIENIIEQIKESENKAKEIIQGANREHTLIIEQAYSDGEKLISQSKKEAADLILNAEIKAKKDSLSDIEELKKQKEKEFNEIDTLVISKKQEAIDIIIKEVFD